MFMPVCKGCAMPWCLDAECGRVEWTPEYERQHNAQSAAHMAAFEGIPQAFERLDGMVKTIVDAHWRECQGHGDTFAANLKDATCSQRMRWIVGVKQELTRIQKELGARSW